MILSSCGESRIDGGGDYNAVAARVKRDCRASRQIAR
jgi:hypothetical protein